MRVGPAILAAQMGSLTQEEMVEGARSQREKIKKDNVSNQDQQTTTRHPRRDRTTTDEVVKIEDLIQPTEGDRETVQMGQTLAPPKAVTTIMLTPGKMICTKEAREGLQILVLTQRR